MKNLILLSLLFLSFSSAFADTMEDEIDHLIASVGKDGCRFVRNDRRYSRGSARAHLRSKWELNSHYVNSTEDFINKIASTSATTGEPYILRCRGGEETIAKEWFFAQLSNLRNQTR